MLNSKSRVLVAGLAAVVLGGFALAPVAEAADRKGGGAAARAGNGGAGARAGGSARPTPQVNDSRKDVRANNVRNNSINNVNNNVNVNRSVNVNVDSRGWDNDYHPIATAAAVTATVAVTSAIVGSIVNAPPPGCVPVNYGGIIYQQCGSTWYQPQGTQYVVINPPY